MNGISAYKENSVETHARGRSIGLRYEGAIKFLKLATTELEARNWAKKGEYINKTLDIITELNACLDMEAGGEVAMNLRRLYVFLNGHLSNANIQRDSRKIQEAIGILEELHEGWVAIAE